MSVSRGLRCFHGSGDGPAVSLFETYTKLVSLAYVVEMGSGVPGPSVVLVEDELEVEGMLQSNVPTLPILSSGPGEMQGLQITQDEEAFSCDSPMKHLDSSLLASSMPLSLCGHQIF